MLNGKRQLKNLPANAGDTGLTLGPGSPWRRKRPPTPVFLPGKSMERRAWWAIARGDAKQLDMTQRLNSNKKAVIGK